MIKIEILHPLLCGVAASTEDGISSYFLSQQMKMPEQRVRYYLNEAEKDGFVKRRAVWRCTNNNCRAKFKIELSKCKMCGSIVKMQPGPKFILTNDAFVQNGFAILYDKRHKQFSFIGCPHFGVCSCTGVITENCSLLKDLKTMPIVKKFLKVRSDIESVEKTVVQD